MTDLNSLLYEDEKELTKDEKRSLVSILYADNKEVRRVLENQEFEVKTLASADWALGVVVNAMVRIERRKNLIAERKQVIKAFMKELDEWVEKASNEDNATISRLSEKLRPFIEEEVLKGKKKSLKFPVGTAGFRKSQDKVEVEDEKAALSFCENNNPDAIKKSLSLSVVKKLLADGVEIPGVKLIQSPDVFYIKPSEKYLQIEGGESDK